MNSSYLLLVVGAVAVAFGLMLLFGEAESVSAPEVAEVVVVGDEGSTGTGVTQAQYWEPVTRTMTAPASSVVVYGVPTAAPCAYCGTVHATGMTVPGDAIVQAPAQRFLIGGCGSPVSPCARPACEQPSCQWPTPTCPQPTRQPRAGGCGTPVAPCADRSCEWLMHTCDPSCATPCGERPGINRNVSPCVDECGFVQLHSTVRQPICSGIRFDWAATRGRFLDPTSSDPMYFTPTVHQAGGEDVVITLTITDPLGARYSDHMRLRVRNVP